MRNADERVFFLLNVLLAAASSMTHRLWGAAFLKCNSAQIGRVCAVAGAFLSPKNFGSQEVISTFQTRLDEYVCVSSPRHANSASIRRSGYVGYLS